MKMNREAREELYDPKKQWAEDIMAIHNPRSMTKAKYIAEKAKRLAKVLHNQGKHMLAKRAEEGRIAGYKDKWEYEWEHNTPAYADPAPKHKRKRSAWLSFVIAHKNMRTKKGLLDLKAISKLWKLKRGKLGK